MTVQDLSFGGYDVPYIAQQIVTSSGTVREEISQLVLNNSTSVMTVHLPAPDAPGRQLRVRNISTGTLGAHTLQCSGGDFDGVNTTITVPPLAEILVFSVGSETWRVSEVKRGYLEFIAAAGALPKPAPGCGLDVVITYAGGATTGTLPAFNAGDVGSSLTVTQSSTQAHKLCSFSPPRIDGVLGTITLGTQIGSAVDLIVTSTGSMITTNRQGNGLTVA